MYARMEEADALIESLMQDKDHNLRMSGMYTVAMAYCGTGNNKAIKRLLHVAVRSLSLSHNIVTQYCHASVTKHQHVTQFKVFLGRVEHVFEKLLKT